MRMQCSKCDKKLSSAPALSRHMRSMHPADGKPIRTLFICTLCSKQFNRSDNFKTHEKTCGRIKPEFTCHLCPKSFRDGWLLKRHIQSHQHKSKVL